MDSICRQLSIPGNFLISTSTLLTELDRSLVHISYHDKILSIWLNCKHNRICGTFYPLTFGSSFPSFAKAMTLGGASYAINLSINAPGSESCNIIALLAGLMNSSSVA